MADLDPRPITSTAPIPATDARERDARTPGRELVDEDRKDAPRDRRDRAHLSATARTHLRVVEDTEAQEVLVDPDGMAAAMTDTLRQSMAAANGVHTAAVYRAARLLR